LGLRGKKKVAPPRVIFTKRERGGEESVPACGVHLDVPRHAGRKKRGKEKEFGA